MRHGKGISAVSIFLAVAFLAAQFVLKSTIDGGVCAPYLGAPVELQQPAYQFTNYGFPIPFITVSKGLCSEAGAVTVQWAPIGLGVDGLLLVLIAYPIWLPVVKRKPDA